MFLTLVVSWRTVLLQTALLHKAHAVDHHEIAVHKDMLLPSHGLRTVMVPRHERIHDGRSEGEPWLAHWPQGVATNFVAVLNH
jgi:hypothetical protein